MTTVVANAAREIAPGAIVGADAAHPAGLVRMVNPHSRLSVLVAWEGGRLEWRDPMDLSVLRAARRGAAWPRDRVFGRE